MSVPRAVFVTGTDTGVGKTVVTAALAAALSAAGRSVAVYKPTQAGLEAGLGDIDVVQRLWESPLSTKASDYSTRWRPWRRHPARA